MSHAIDYADPAILHGLAENHLTDRPDFGRGARLTPETAAAFALLREDARRAGIDLRAASSFRSFTRQKTIFEEKIAGKRPVLDRSENPLDVSRLSREELIRAILYFSAAPGLSRHHWGTDIDVYDPSAIPPEGGFDLTNACYRSGCQRRLGAWLGDALAKRGFFRPYARDGLCAGELWHISYAPEADRFAAALDPGETAAFLRGPAGLADAGTLLKIVLPEFGERYRIFAGAGR